MCDAATRAKWYTSFVLSAVMGVFVPETKPVMTNYIALLRRNPGYARLWLAQAISLLGDWFSLIAISTLVSRQTGGSGLAVSGLLLAQLLPIVVVGPFAGVLVDRLDRKKLLIISDFARAGLRLMLLFAIQPGQLWLVYLITVLHFCLSAVFEPARSALLPSVVREDDLVNANVLSSVTWSVMLAVGGVSGGLVAAFFGTVTALVLNALTFALSGVLIIAIRRNQIMARRGTVEQKEKGGMLDGLRYARRHPATAAALFIKSGAIGNIDALMIIYGTQVFVMGENGAASVGLLYAAFGVGAIVGPLIFNRFNNGTTQRMRRLVTMTYVLNVVGWVAFGLAPSLWLAALGITLRAMGGSTGWTYSSVIIQQSVEDRYLGRMFSLDLAMVQLASVASALLTGWAVDMLGAGRVATVVFATAAAAIVPLIMWALALPWVERHDQHEGNVLVQPATGT